jgi:hypothetical protein
LRQGRRNFLVFAEIAALGRIGKQEKEELWHDDEK